MKATLKTVGLLIGIYLFVGSAPALCAQEVVFWFHASSEDSAEFQVMRKQVAAFNTAQSQHHVKMVSLPEGSYDEIVFARALAGDLPDLLDFDGPNIASYVWQGFLQPLDKYIDPAVIDNLLPSIKLQGTYPADGRLYSIGTFDSGLALWGNKRLLRKAGVTLPGSIKNAWSLAQFEAVLAKLAKTPGVSYPLDIKLNYGQGEWFTYGFTPIIQSMGGDVINRDTWRASGTLDSDAAVRALSALQRWQQKAWIVPAAKGDKQFYKEQDVGLSLVGHWMWGPHNAALGDDLVLIPMPKFGPRHVTGMGSWNFSISADAQNPEGAAKFLEYLLLDDEVLRMTDANGAVPATVSALKKSKKYASPAAPLYIYAEQLHTIALNRPFHPAYPTITQAFATAVANILKGNNVRAELRRAARAVDDDIADSDGYYPFIKKPAGKTLPEH